MLIRPALRTYRTWSIDSARWSVFAPRPGDIVIATSPKCGTTWTQQIVSSLVFQDGAARALSTVSPWPDTRFRLSLDELQAALEAQTHRRFLKTHAPLDGLPLYDEVRYIHVARDGRDAALAMHNHYGGFTDEHLALLDRIGLEDPEICRPYPRLPADPRAYVRRWLTEGVIAGQTDGWPSPSFFELEAGYWAERRRPNLLLVHYNDLKADLDGEMRRIATFLDIPVDGAVWPELVDAARFETMRARGPILMPPAHRQLRGGARRFFNRGVSGHWRNVLGEAERSLYAEKAQAMLSPGLGAWLEGGRLSAGDPKASED